MCHPEAGACRTPPGTTPCLTRPHLVRTSVGRVSVRVLLSTSPWGSPFPPVHRGLGADDPGHDLRRDLIAELPQFLRRPRVLKEDLVDIGRIQLTGSIPIDGLLDMRQELDQLRLVISRHGSERPATFGLVGHDLRLPGSDALQELLLPLSTGTRGTLPLSGQARREEVRHAGQGAADFWPQWGW